MLRALVVMLTLLVLPAGCAHRPLKVVMSGDVTARMPPENTASSLRSRVVEGPPCSDVRVAVIDIDGLLLNKNFRGYGSLGENPVALFREKLEMAEADPSVRAVVLRIDSPGGGVTASDIMRRDLAAFKARTGLPVVASVMELGTGGAYYLASAADVIVAHPTSLVGGIGVILNLYNLEDSLGQFNVVAIPVKSGDKIDMASPVRTMDPEERDILERIAGEFHQRFQDEVLRSRPHATPAEGDFDGRVFTAQEARAKGLVDGIGYLDDAIAAAREAAGISGSSAVVIYRRCNDRAMTAYEVTPNVPLQNSLLPMNIPGLDRSSLPRFLYLWQPDPSLVTVGSGR